MALVTTKTVTVFDLSDLEKGDLIYVKNDLWNDPKKGIVLYASEEKIVVLYYPGMANVTNRHEMTASEISDGTYTVRWTKDMETIHEYSPEGDSDDT